MLTEGAMVGDGVEGGWVEFGEGRVRVLAVKAFLETVDHGLPVEAPGVRDAAAVGKLGEIDGVRESF